MTVTTRKANSIWGGGQSLGQLWEPGCGLDQDKNSGRPGPARAALQDLQEENQELGTLLYGKSICPGRGQLACVRVRVPACGCKSVRTCEWRRGGAMSGPSPVCSPAASRQPQPSVVADVWLCHGNARTGCTSGLQQGQARTHRPPTPFPSPKACCKERFGSRSGTNGVCIRRQAELASSEGSVAGEEEDACAQPS